MVREAKLKDSGAGLVPASTGWFVMNAHDARWSHRPGRGDSLPLTGRDEFEAETYFPMLGMSIQVLPPGEPNATYHWETEQEDFLVLAGEGLAIIEGEERPIKQWDFVHCPPETRHVFVGVGDVPCVILAASSRRFQKDGPSGFYCADETAARYDASSPEDTQDGSIAYGRAFRMLGRCATATSCCRTQANVRSYQTRSTARSLYERGQSAMFCLNLRVRLRLAAHEREG